MYVFDLFTSDDAVFAKLRALWVEKCTSYNDELKFLDTIKLNKSTLNQVEERIVELKSLKEQDYKTIVEYGINKQCANKRLMYRIGVMFVLACVICYFTE